jgi:uncharacterized protein involved in exopolysaccharide biosynthesis
MVESMADTREMTMEDYLAMVRRRLKVVVVPLLIAPIAGFLVSYGFQPRYQSQASVAVMSAKLGSSFVEPVITHDFSDRVNELQGRILSITNLQTMVTGMGLAKPGADAEKLAEEIRPNVTVLPVISALTQAEAGLAAKKKPGTVEAVPSVSITYIDTGSAERAQRICNALANQFVNADLTLRVDTTKETSDFMGRQVAAAKQDLDNQDAKLAEFKQAHWGQLPGDADNNMKILQSQTTQLDATTQSLNRAQQDKSYAESMLAQNLATWKASLSSTNPQTLEQQLTALQTQLLQLQARYTDDYPDVVKTKADIAKVQGRLDEVNKLSGTPTAASDKASANEPPEIRQQRLQIHQYQEAIEQYQRQQQALEASIRNYDKLTHASPEIEQQWSVLNRDYASKQKFYNDLLSRQSSADLGKQAENSAEGEQVTIGQSANKPDSPTFPNRILFAAGGLAGGMGLGLLIAIWLEFSDKSIRTERDAAVAMDLPLLISVPWVGGEEPGAAYGNGNGNGRRKFWGRTPADKDEEKIGV